MKFDNPGAFSGTDEANPFQGTYAQYDGRGDELSFLNARDPSTASLLSLTPAGFLEIVSIGQTGFLDVDPDPDE